MVLQRHFLLFIAYRVRPTPVFIKLEALKFKHLYPCCLGEMLLVIVRIVLCVFLFVKCNDTFNLSPKSAQIITFNSSGSYFGYSVLLKAPTNTAGASVIVGAPKANSSFSLHRNIVEPGAVFTCPLSTSKCQQFLLDPKGNVNHKGTNGMTYHHLKDHGWLGASIDGNDVADGFLVTCAPRWVNQIRKQFHFLQNGICYLLVSTANSQKTAEELMPLLHSGFQGFAMGKEAYFYYAMGQVGFSIHVSKDTSDILLGAPGVLQWKGTIVKYPYNATNFNKDLKSVNVYNVTIPNPYFINKIIQESYFGYSVSSGHFLNDSLVVWFVGGAPRGNELYGQVLLFEYSSDVNGRPDLMIHRDLKGSQLGEYFGSAIAVADVNSDGADDIFVGAPMYNLDSTVEAGCVYYYLNDGEGNFRVRRLLGASNYKSRFGSAISSVGDLNKDGYQDIVVGAPFYNEGKGAVFIYLGSEDGVSKNYQQIITAEEINVNLKSFGSSLSRGVDIDKNNYNDVAVGSYLSDQVVIIKSQPIVSVSIEMMSSIDKFLIDTYTFSINVCLKYTGESVPSTLNIYTSVEADSLYERVVFVENHFNVIKMNEEYKFKELSCTTLFANISKRHQEFTNPLDFKTTYEITQNPNQNNFCSTCPILDKTHKNTATLRIPFYNGCENNDICKSELQLNAKYIYDKPNLVIGSENHLDVQIEVSNTGEPAFNCILFVNLTSDMFLEKIPEICEYKEKTLVCSIGNPLQKNRTKKLRLQLDISSLTHQEYLVLSMNVTSLGSETNLNDNIQVLNMPLVIEKNIVVLGTSKPTSYTYVNTKKEVRVDYLMVSHDFLIENMGPSPAGYSEITFYIPYKVKDVEEPILKMLEPSAYLDEQPVICVTPNKNGFYKSDEENLKDTDITDLSPTKVKRSIESTTTESTEDTTTTKSIALDKFPGNRTIHFNCNSSNFEESCFQITCITSPLKKVPTYLMINFQFVANIKLLDTLADWKDIIVISSTIEVKSDDIFNNLRTSQVHTILHGSQKEESPLKWIIIGVLVGIILLTILVYSLYKFGFFKRTAHEQLLNEKEGILEEKMTPDSNESDIEDNL